MCKGLYLILQNHMGQEQIIEKIKQVPDEYQQQVEDFIDFILEKKSTATQHKNPPRQFGLLKGKIIMSPDFDAPLPD